MPGKVERGTRPDYGILVAFLGLVCIGLFCVASASYAMARGHTGSPYHFIAPHIFYIVLSVVLFIPSAFVGAARWQKFAFGLFLVALVLCALVFVPGLGVKANGATRWLHLGPVRFQPSELLKLGLIGALAVWLTRPVGNPRRLWPGIAVALAMTGASTLVVIKQNDLGTALVIVLISFGMLTAAGVTKRRLLMFVAGMMLCAVIAVRVEPYRMDRVKAWLNPWEYKTDESYQVVQSLYAFGIGSWHGAGFGQGQAKYYLPAPHTDFVFATAAEETGVFGPIIIIGLFTAIGYSGLRVARRNKTPFGRLAAVGIVTFLCGQAALNIAVVTSAVPCTGVPLPFISYGGSSLMVGAMSLGLLLALSRSVCRASEENRDEGDGNRRGYGRTHLSGPRNSSRTGTPRPRTPTLIRR